MNKNSNAATLAEKPKHGPDQKRFAPFIGQWKIEGQNQSAAPEVANTRVSGEDSYEWLPGEFFLINRWDRRFAGAGEHEGIGVIGFDAEQNAYFAQCFDNLGYHRVYETSITGRTLSLRGPWERGTSEVSADGQSMTVHWERSIDGTNWEPLCDLKATRIR